MYKRGQKVLQWTTGAYGPVVDAKVDTVLILDQTGLLIRVPISEVIPLNEKWTKLPRKMR